MHHRERGPQRALLILLSGLLLLIVAPGRSQAQEADGWWARVVIEAGNDDSGHVHRGRRRAPRRLHIPNGHLPPPGECRLWYPGQPPGQQPPPLSCEEAIHRQRGAAVVVTHDGSVYGAATPRGGRPHWQRRRTDGMVFRRRPDGRDRVTVSVEILINLLGRDGYRQLAEQRRRLGVRGELVGRWVPTGRSDGHVLQVRAGRHPLAELADWNGDGRVDVMLVRASR